jgi:hypothetical protein
LQGGESRAFELRTQRWICLERQPQSKVGVELEQMMDDLHRLSRKAVMERIAQHILSMPGCVRRISECKLSYHLRGAAIIPVPRPRAHQRHERRRRESLRIEHGEVLARQAPDLLVG